MRAFLLPGAFLRLGAPQCLQHPKVGQRRRSAAVVNEPWCRGCSSGMDSMVPRGGGRTMHCVASSSVAQALPQKRGFAPTRFLSGPGFAFSFPCHFLSRRDKPIPWSRGRRAACGACQDFSRASPIVLRVPRLWVFRARPARPTGARAAGYCSYCSTGSDQNMISAPLMPSGKRPISFAGLLRGDGTVADSNHDAYLLRSRPVSWAYRFSGESGRFLASVDFPSAGPSVGRAQWSAAERGLESAQPLEGRASDRLRSWGDA